MPAAILLARPSPWLSSTRTDSTLVFQPSPAMPIAVVGDGGDEPGHGRAVPLGVGRVVTGEVLAEDDLAGQVGLGGVDVGVDHGHQHVGVAVGDGPGLGGADVHEVGLAVDARRLAAVERQGAARVAALVDGRRGGAGAGAGGGARRDERLRAGSGGISAELKRTSASTWATWLFCLSLRVAAGPWPVGTSMSNTAGADVAGVRTADRRRHGVLVVARAGARRPHHETVDVVGGIGDGGGRPGRAGPAARDGPKTQPDAATAPDLLSAAIAGTSPAAASSTPTSVAASTGRRLMRPPATVR